VSSATVYLEDNRININENTLIRIQQSGTGRGSYEVELREGNLSLTSGNESMGIYLNLFGKQVHTAAGAAIDAAAGEEGITVQVNEGTVKFIEEGQTRELSEGTMIAQDQNGMERIVPAVVVTRPLQNASSLKKRAETLPIVFAWNRINLADDDTLRLEFAWDRDFTQGLHVVENLGSRAQVGFDTGVWHWRLCLGDTVLRTGLLNVTDSSGPMLLSPVMNSKFRYQNSLPQIRFQWSQRTGATHYILEVCDTPAFENLQIDKQLAASSYVQSELGSGTWYWRVRAVFPSAYEGTADYSVYSAFVIEKTDDPQAIALEVPEPSEIVRPLVSSIPVTSAIHEHVQAAADSVQSGASHGIEQVGAAIESIASHAGSAAAVVSRRIRSAVSHLPGSQHSAAAAAAGESGTSAEHDRKIHIVQIGETLSRIAHLHYGSYQLFTKIVDANNIENPDLIYPSQELHIPQN
jgi:hypothetical protein